MDKPISSRSDLPTHGAAVLPSVTVDSYNIAVRDGDGFIGDKASKGAFWEIVEKWRKPLRKADEDPFGNRSTDKLTKDELVAELEDGDPEAAGLAQSAVEEFSQQFARVIRRFLQTKEWRDTDAIVVGVVMHNDAVVQGLSELPRMQDRERWAVLTIGTGLGNARFTNRNVKKGS